jgi:transposase
VLGVDDFAFQRGRRYGTILVDLERRCPVDLLPDREVATLNAWLKAHPGVEILSRDRGGNYKEGATAGAPDAVQVIDRWHLLKNLGEALEQQLARRHKDLRQASLPKDVEEAQHAAQPSTPPLPQPAERPQHRAGLTAAQKADKEARRDRWLARYEEVKRLLSEGFSQREVARRTGHSRVTVRKLAACVTFPEVADRQPCRNYKVAPFARYLHQRWQEGHCTASRLYQEIVALGYTGSALTVQ